MSHVQLFKVGRNNISKGEVKLKDSSKSEDIIEEDYDKKTYLFLHNCLCKPKILEPY